MSSSSSVTIARGDDDVEDFMRRLDRCPALAQSIQHVNIDSPCNVLKLLRRLSPLESVHLSSEAPWNAWLPRQMPTVSGQVVSEDLRVRRLRIVSGSDGAPPEELFRTALSHLHGVEQLELWGGWHEEVPHTSIPAHWPIDTLHLDSDTGEDVDTRHLLTIHTLVLNLSCGLSFGRAPPSTSARLENLTIIDNDAMDHFVKMAEQTCLARELRSLRIRSTNGCDRYNWDLRDANAPLSRLANLARLELEIDPKTGPDDEDARQFFDALPASLPPNLEVLWFRGPAWLATRLAPWEACVADPGWLPNLKEVRFRLDAKGYEYDGVNSRYKANDTTYEKPARDAAERLMGAFRDRRPGIRTQMEWPMLLEDENTNRLPAS
jgi:hypothetical protein